MTTEAPGTPVETKLIGSILQDEGDRANGELFDHFDLIDRSISAPPQISARIQEAEDGKFVDSRSGEKINPKDVRLNPEYSEYYYSQRPIDPRLPPPLLNWSSAQLAKVYKGPQENDGLQVIGARDQKKNEGTSNTIQEPMVQRAFSPHSLLEKNVGKVPSMQFNRSEAQGTGISSLFSSDDAGGIPSYRGPVPTRPQSARPSDVGRPDRLMNTGIRLRLHSQTPPGSIAELSQETSSKLLEQLRHYQDRKVQQQPTTAPYQPQGGQRYSPKRGHREDPPADITLGLRKLNMSNGKFDDGALRRDYRRRGGDGGGARGNHRGRFFMQKKTHQERHPYGPGHGTQPELVPYHLPAQVYPQQVSQYHDEALHPRGGYAKRYVRGSEGGGRRWEHHAGHQMGHRGPGQDIPMDYPLPYRSGPPVQGDYYAGHGQRDMYWEQEIGGGRVRDYYLMQQMGNGAGAMDRYDDGGGRMNRRRGGRNGGGRGRHRGGGGGGGSRNRRNNNMRGQYGRGMNSPPHYDRRGDRYDRQHDRGGDRHDRCERYNDRHDRQDYGGRDMRRQGEAKRNRYQMQNPAVTIAPGEANTIGTTSAVYEKWMAEFKTNQTTHITLEDVAKRDMVVDLAMDQYGSRFIQQKLETAPTNHKEISFGQVYPEALRLCTDVFGNYVIQKMFDYGTPEQRKTLAAQLEGHVLTLALQMYGCRVVQKAIDVLELDQKVKVVKELHGHVMRCVRDQNGNHVIQKCIEKVPAANIQFIIEAFKNQNVKLAMHPYGCRVIQRLLEHCSSQQRNAMLNEILEHTQGLAKNQFGNYVIQHVLIHGSARHRAAVIKSFYGILFPLSKHKFASNVIEKCVTHATRQERQQLIEEILGTDRVDAVPPLMGMVRDQFANYVVQRLIDVMDPEQRQYLIQRIHRHLPNLRKIPYGKHIVARIEKIAGSLARDSTF
mmetsp:Transcript_30988/g.75567  ORF Transcript_30988/g.75567 Transcript_30988/m.75567 type:complete len:941 (-) Transcript_30988:317-3139(-)